MTPHELLDQITADLRQADEAIEDIRRTMREAMRVAVPVFANIEQLDRLVDLLVRSSVVRAGLETQLRQARQMANLSTSPKTS